jgi:2-polyprenyl-3-methyl-5-hydroxy-6-metoxy-1,4-benzoquinol methylase
MKKDRIMTSIWPRGELIRRVLRPELLESAEPAIASRNLLDIARINSWFGGHRALLRVFKDLAPPQKQFSVLDVGAGSGDMGECLRRRFPNAMVVSLDHRSFNLRNAPGPRVAADAFQLPFFPKAFDFVLCSSVLHHFSDCEAIELIAELRRFARCALIVLDLERHPLPYKFLTTTKRLFGWSALTVHDGPISVAAGFRPEELAHLAHVAIANPVRVRRHWPWFRISIVVPACVSQHLFVSVCEQP